MPQHDMTALRASEEIDSPLRSMTTPNPRICCIPVSWPSGFGELARLLTLTHAACQRWPDLRVHVVVNRNLPAAALARIPAAFDLTLLDTSPTLDDRGVTAALDRCRPDVVLFDNAGTGRQCRHAKRLGAATVFLSTRPATRRRGLALDWIPWLDEHWLIAPAPLDDALTVWQRFKLTLAPRTVVRRLQSIYLPSVAARRSRLQRAIGCAKRPYVCFAPGGGGGRIAGATAVSVFAAAARAIAERTGIRCVLLQGPLYDGPSVSGPRLAVCAATHEQTVDLIEAAQLVVLGASSTLFQALAQGKVCVATAAGGAEQLLRARAWAARSIVWAAEPTPDSIAASACHLLENRRDFEATRRRVAELGVTNDLARALTALRGLLDSAPGAQC